MFLAHKRCKKNSQIIHMSINNFNSEFAKCYLIISWFQNSLIPRCPTKEGQSLLLGVRAHGQFEATLSSQLYFQFFPQLQSVLSLRSPTHKSSSFLSSVLMCPAFPSTFCYCQGFSIPTGVPITPQAFLTSPSHHLLLFLLRHYVDNVNTSDFTWGLCY